MTESITPPASEPLDLTAIRARHEVALRWLREGYSYDDNFNQAALLVRDDVTALLAELEQTRAELADKTGEWQTTGQFMADWVKRLKAELETARVYGEDVARMLAAARTETELLRGWLVDAELQLTAANRAAAMQGMRLPMDVVHPEVFAPWDDDVAAVPGDGVNRKLDLRASAARTGSASTTGLCRATAIRPRPPTTSCPSASAPGPAARRASTTSATAASTTRPSSPRASSVTARPAAARFVGSVLTTR